MKRFYITTPIYYVTAKPHLGSLYSTLIADVLARYHALCGQDTYFLTGTDEHGQKVAQAATAAGVAPQEFVDSFIPAYKECWQRYGIAYDRFVRTTEPEHIHGAQTLVSKLLERGYIYKSIYEGWYCTPCETFVTDKELIAESIPLCPTCDRQTHRLAEETYYFKLSAFQEPLLKFYAENPYFIIPKERLKEVISFVEGGLKDLSVSRTSVPWGVPFPRDARHTIYVWVEALCNYITAVGYGDAHKIASFTDYWPADLQVLGKDIVRFHAVHWLALLMAAGLPLPKKLLVHGWITVDHQKMSKSLGNVIDPLVLQATYGADAVRYYLMRHIPITHDGNFSIADFEQTIIADLAHTLGNLFNRASVLAHNNNSACVRPPALWSVAAEQIMGAVHAVLTEYKVHMESGHIHLAIAAVQQYLHILNAYFHAQAPWKLAKSDMQACIEVLSVIAHSLHAVALLLLPIMPHVMVQLLHGLGIDTAESSQMLFATIEKITRHTVYTYAVIPPLFVKPEQSIQEPTVQPTISKPKTEEISTLSIDDFMKVQLCVGTITSAEPVEKSDKLIKLQVDFGSQGSRQILTGMRLHHAPEFFIGMQAVFVFNLKPRMMMGHESHGMLLAAQDEHGVSQPVSPVKTVINGTMLT